MRLLYWLTTSVIKVSAWHFFPPWLLCFLSEIIYCCTVLFIDKCVWWMQMRQLGERARWWSDHIARNTRLRQEQLLQLHPLGRHVSPPPRVHMQACCCKAATKRIHSALTTLWILWHITSTLSSLSGTKALIIGLIATAIFISLCNPLVITFCVQYRLIL